MRRTILAAYICLLVGGWHAQGAPLKLMGQKLQVQVDGASGQETLSVNVDGAWQAALSAASSVYVQTDAGKRTCAIKDVVAVERGLLIHGDCGIGSFEQRISLTTEEDVVDVTTRLNLNENVAIGAVEDRYNFLP